METLPEALTDEELMIKFQGDPSSLTEEELERLQELFPLMGTEA